MITVKHHSIVVFLCCAYTDFITLMDGYGSMPFILFSVIICGACMMLNDVECVVLNFGCGGGKKFQGLNFYGLGK